MRSISLAVLLASILCGPAQAFCSYRGKDYATTTVRQEFRDARYVAEVEVLSGMAAWADEPDARFRARWGEEGSVVTFHLKTLRAYKGAPPRIIRFFSGRNSGGFYFERRQRMVGSRSASAAFYVGANHATDVGGRYLVFLNPIRPHQGMGTVERGATFVNYACGQSKLWREVTRQERQLLERLKRKRG